MNLKNWLKSRKLKAEFLNPRLFTIKGVVGCFYILKPEDGILIDIKNRIFVTNLDDINSDYDYFCYEWGGEWFYEFKDYEKIEFKPLEDIGGCSEFEADRFYHLGVHGKFEKHNGTGHYEDWIKRAKFFGHEGLGLVEKNTLAGILHFQAACLKEKIKPILGEEVSVVDEKTDTYYNVKLYVKNKEGWKNLLLINTEIKVKNLKEFITFKRLIELTEGLIVVLDKSIKLSLTLIRDYRHYFGVGDVYYQFDTVEWKNNVRDKEYLDIVKHNFSFYDKIPFVLINDSYYINSESAHIKKKLNEMDSKGSIQEISDKQYYKTITDSFAIILPLFKEGDDRIMDFLEMKDNTVEIADRCNFIFDTSKTNLPNFTQTHLPEKLKRSSNEDLIWVLIGKGIEDRITNKNPMINLDPYLERVEYEMSVITKGGFIDYFLILWDICRFSYENEILVGIGRGSAGGALIAYLLKITHLDPLEYGLLFERFLNEGRVERGELPDIDVDFEGERRGDIKRYMESVYGEERVCSVGTYGTFQLAAGMKDLLKNRGASFYEVNEIIKRAGFVRNDSWDRLFWIASERKDLAKLIEEYPEVVTDLRIIHKQPRSISIHACATIILPRRDEEGNPSSLFTTIPVRAEGKNLISEWEGEDLANAGYLKEDILGTKQLEKFRFILKLIKEAKLPEVDFYNIPLDDEKVYELYKKGLNSDNFHFGSRLLKRYSRKIKPDNIKDLIAMIALVRPGSLSAGAADKYVKYKSGELEPKFYYHLRDITKDTYGLFVYQEQVMKICQELGGFSLVEADIIRKVVGKKKMKELRSYREQFIKGATKRGCPIIEAEDIWNQIEVHGAYSFNMSHSAAYAITGYISQWFKANYPLQFWITAFQYADKEDIPEFISEINQLEGLIKLKSVDINLSKNDFYAIRDSHDLYWSIEKVRQIGGVALEGLSNEIEEGGSFFSLVEFIKRVKKNKRKITKASIQNLIFAGAFDQLENIEKPSDRIRLMKILKEELKLKEEDLIAYKEESKIDKDWWWLLQQKYYSEFAFFNYEEIATEELNLSKVSARFGFKAASEILNEDTGYLITAGIIKEIVVRSKQKRGAKKGVKADWARIVLDQNFEEFPFIIWDEEWPRFKEEILNQEGKILLIEKVESREDTYRGGYQIQAGKKTIIKVLK